MAGWHNCSCNASGQTSGACSRLNHGLARLEVEVEEDLRNIGGVEDLGSHLETFCMQISRMLQKYDIPLSILSINSFPITFSN